LINIPINILEYIENQMLCINSLRVVESLISMKSIFDLRLYNMAFILLQAPMTSPT
jgi:hypothetical protein